MLCIEIDLWYRFRVVLSLRLGFRFRGSFTFRVVVWVKHWVTVRLHKAVELGLGLRFMFSFMS